MWFFFFTTYVILILIFLLKLKEANWIFEQQNDMLGVGGYLFLEY